MRDPYLGLWVHVRQGVLGLEKEDGTYAAHY